MSCLVFCSFEVGGWPYAIAELLNRRGVPVYYVTTARSAGHDSAEFHFGDAAASWNVSNEVGRPVRLGLSGRQLERLVARLRVDRCFATGHLACVLERAGIPYKYWSYGSDLDDLCFWPEVPQRWSAKTAAYYGYCAASVVVARRTFRRASSVMISPYQQEALTRVCPGQNLFFLPHVVRPVELEQVMRRKEQARQRLCLELDATHLFFSSTRHHWLRRRPPGGYRPLSSDEKGNDLVLRAFAGFRRAARGGNPKLVLVCKGPDVDASRRLAAKLGVDDAVVWRGEMKRAELETYYAAADVCFGQFGAPVLTYSCIEPLAWATPTVSLIATGSSNPVPFYADLPPVCSTRDPDVMADFLHKMTEDRAAGLEAGRQSWEWVVGNCSEQTFLEAFNREI